MLVLLGEPLCRTSLVNTWVPLCLLDRRMTWSLRLQGPGPLSVLQSYGVRRNTDAALDANGAIMAHMTMLLRSKRPTCTSTSVTLPLPSSCPLPVSLTRLLCTIIRGVLQVTVILQNSEFSPAAAPLPFIFHTYISDTIETTYHKFGGDMLRISVLRDRRCAIHPCKPQAPNQSLRSLEETQ
ncbi:hypothetical protein GY45DRAFT_598323 [Cubamyces sp. BRFM 1775]|nr:hypothetical protein GY45DRAFT_598323 [Cubamyces sp. BRFM 1775]